MFGDVNLQEAPLPPKFEAGKGGWPTVRYFNAETGPDGAPYQQKTSKSVCDELGDIEYMRAYIKEKTVKPCDVTTLDNCSEQDKKFLDVWRVKPLDVRAAEGTRLERLAGTKGKLETLKWVRQRAFLLRQLASASAPASASQTPEL